MDIRAPVAHIYRSIRADLQAARERLQDCDLPVASGDLRDCADLTRGCIILALRAVDMLRGHDALERGLDHRFGRSRNDIEREATFVGARIEVLDEALDILLQSHLPPGLDQVFATDAPEFGIVTKEVRELGALLHEVALGKAGDFLLKVRYADQAAENEPRVIET